jgi:general stress protein 26
MLTQPKARLDPRYSYPDAKPTPWEDAQSVLRDAQTYWITTVRDDGSPHVVTLIAVWMDGAMHFCTGADEQKAVNIAANAHCAITTGTNEFAGLDVVVEGEANRLTDDAALRRLAQAYVEKYGEEWRFEPRDGLFHHEEGAALVFTVQPVRAFGFVKGPGGGQTTWRF